MHKRLSRILAEMPRDERVVVDIGDDVDAVLVPGDIIGRVRAAYQPMERQAVLEIVALLIARLSTEEAVPLVRGWIEKQPDALRHFPASLLETLRKDPEALVPTLGPTH